MNSLDQSKNRTIRNTDIEKIKSYLVKSLTTESVGLGLTEEERREEILQRLDDIYSKTGLNLPDSLRTQVFRDVLDELIGYGPIQPLLENPNITEVMVNGPKLVYIEKDGKITKTKITFENDNHVIRVIERIVLPLGRRIDAESPTVDARLPDGSRVNAVIPPVAIDGPSLTIRKFSTERLGVDQLISYNSITRSMVDFLHACVVAKLNILISGGTGSGKTTLLNVLSSLIPESDRIVTIEDAAELQMQQEHIVRLETQTADLDGRGQVTTRDLVRNSLRMRPDRIIVGEVRGGEALDMLQAMNTGHDGSMTTLHANAPRDALSRLETLTLMSEVDLPADVVRKQIAAAVDLIVQVARMRDGSRKVTAITEVAGMEGDTVVLTDIFKYEQTGITDDGKLIGDLKPTGIRPLFSPTLEMAGFKLKPEIFGANITEILNSNRRRR